MRRYEITPTWQGLITERREPFGLSQADLAKALGYRNPESVSMLEKFEREVPFEKLILLADALKLDRGWLCAHALEETYPELAREIKINLKKQLLRGESSE